MSPEDIDLLTIGEARAIAERAAAAYELLKSIGAVSSAAAPYVHASTFGAAHNGALLHPVSSPSDGRIVTYPPGTEIAPPANEKQKALAASMTPAERNERAKALAAIREELPPDIAAAEES